MIEAVFLLAALYYPEERVGEAALFVEVGAAAFLSARGALADRAPPPRALGLGFSYEIEAVRLAWRARLASHPDRPGRFAQLDLVGVERVLAPAQARWRPFWRLSLGLALDLESGGAARLGDEGYFDGGPSGGFALAHAWGLDLRLGGGFLRLEAEGKAYEGVGLGGALLAGHLAGGWCF
ncbi:hypothetical protein KKF91_04545 [Myxococcota bacterium]|nr:hypothetical protein [Myxococcota bacterium]MBU1429816.1 hypothetical protein [Myxococcota bacterium]MBU1899418.1 hypothetical protein [Myxococcota bacterium]